MLTRRSVTAALLTLPVLNACKSAPQSLINPDWLSEIRRIEQHRGGRIGVAALDMETGRMLSHRQDERYAMCSTFKWILGGVILAKVEAGRESLNREIAITQDDIVYHAPTTGPMVGSALSIEALCAATIANSDNPAANLLLKTLGGPEGFTQALREIGDETTRLDRFELELNENKAGDPRDTTTPSAMLHLMQRMLFGDILSPEARSILQGWMLATTTGPARLPAGLPQGWTIGHKTGTSYHDANNDVGFALPPETMGRKPILIASFSDGPGAMEPYAETAHADVARAVFKAFV